ncbi:MAG: antibiotic biosynthesis monooxygenase [Chloroflexota bacterium]|nr:antibiotic biosynthesis monooxygenase [Chloroflexota bacterium]
MNYLWDRMTDFVQVLVLRARHGEEDAVVALHEDWQRRLRGRTNGYLYGELFTRPNDPSTFISVARYESEEACRAAADDPEQAAWYSRLVSLLDSKPCNVDLRSAWRCFEDAAASPAP